MLTKSTIVGISITMTVADRQVLMILLVADGTINRMGTGEENNPQTELFVGNNGGALFAELVGHLDPDLDRWRGRFSDSERMGRPCCLTVGIVDQDRNETACQFEYGTESSGPPSEVCDFVLAAIEITDDWYEEQLG